jgi:hypothetical protein
MELLTGFLQKQPHSTHAKSAKKNGRIVFASFAPFAMKAFERYSGGTSRLLPSGLSAT